MTPTEELEIKQASALREIATTLARTTAGAMNTGAAIERINALVRAVPTPQEEPDIITYNPLVVPSEIPGEFPTGIGSLDKFLNGGLRRGELAYVSADAKVGKTTFLITLAAHLVLSKPCKILHSTLEIYPDVVQQRYTESFLRMPMPMIAPENLRDLVPKLLGSIDIVDMVANPTIPALATLVEKTKPDLVVVDYGDLMHTQADSRFIEAGAIWEQLRALARTHNCAVWTASLVNNDGRDGASYLKKFHCDLHVHLDAQPEARNTGVATLTVHEIRRRLGRQEDVKVLYAPDVGYIGGL